MVIVSLTSFGERLQKEASVAIQSILNNTVLPDKICLIIDSGDTVPKEIEEVSLVEIIESDLDIKGHNKYYHTIQKYPNDVIILIDDDHYYPHTFIDSCIKAYQQNPNMIHACRTHKILRMNNHILPYKMWKWDVPYHEPSFDLFFTGCGGVVLFPGAITKEDVCLDEIYKYLTVDDILLNTICRRKRILINKINTYHKAKELHIVNNKPCLSRDNLKGINDKALYQIGFESLLNKIT